MSTETIGWYRGNNIVSHIAYRSKIKEVELIQWMGSVSATPPFQSESYLYIRLKGGDDKKFYLPDTPLDNYEDVQKILEEADQWLEQKYSQQTENK